MSCPCRDAWRGGRARNESEGWGSRCGTRGPWGWRGMGPAELRGKGLSFGCHECQGVRTNPETEPCESVVIHNGSHLSSGLGQVLGPEVDTVQGPAQQEAGSNVYPLEAMTSLYI